MRVNVIYNRMPHHGSYAGYDQVARYLAAKVPVEKIQPYMPRFIPDRTRQWLVRQSGMEWYEDWSLDLETATARQMLGAGKGEVFHIFYGEDNYRYLGLLPRLGRSRGCKLVCTYHQPPQILQKVAPHNTILRNLDALIAVASNQVDYFRSFVDAGAVHVVPHGIDTDFFQPPDQKESTGRECLFVGQWLRDFDMLRDVIRSVERTGAGLTFTIVTTDENFNKFDGLRNTVVVSRLTDEQLLTTYQRADLLVLPMKDCTANNSVLEGMACGLPVVTTDVGGVKDYVTPACASLVASGDVEAMRDAILLLTSDEQLRARMGHEGRARALRFAWWRVADELLEVYSAL